MLERQALLSNISPLANSRADYRIARVTSVAVFIHEKSRAVSPRHLVAMTGGGGQTGVASKLQHITVVAGKGNPSRYRG